MNKQNKGNGSRGIEWTDYTWNPIAGCFHGCEWTMPDGSQANCYAEDVADKVAQAAYPHGFEHHYWKPQLLSKPGNLKTPSHIFVGSMADVFGHWVPDEQIQAVLDVAAECPQHQFQFLTKNAPRLLKFVFPTNCWVGASVPPSRMFGKDLTPEQQVQMLKKTLRVLGDVDAETRWMSIEPLSWNIAEDMWDLELPLKWVVIGAASNGKTLYQPDTTWVQHLLMLMDAEDIPVFFKGNLDWPADQWREEFPAIPEPPTQLSMF